MYKKNSEILTVLDSFADRLNLSNNTLYESAQHFRIDVIGFCVTERMKIWAWWQKADWFYAKHGVVQTHHKWIMASGLNSQIDRRG